MLKNIKKILLSFLLILPLCFAFVGCGENPETPPEPSTPGGSNPPVTQTYFYVSADYALNEPLTGLLENPEEVKVSTSDKYSLIKFSGVLADYFDGWYTRPDDTKIEGETLSGTGDQHIQIYAKWKPDLYECYYSDGVTFVTDDSTQTATVSGYSGTESKVYLPKKIVKEGSEFQVTKIGDDAFSGKDVSSVVLLAPEVEVGNNAFQNTKLEEFAFDRVKSIGESAFSGTKIQSVTVSNKLQSLSRYAFAGCENLESVDLTQSSATLTAISFNCFNGCTALSDVKLSLYVTSLSSQAFSGCTNLQDISFVGQNINDLGANVFEGCDKIQEFNLSSNINRCAENALGGLSITKITISKIIVSTSEAKFNFILGTTADHVEEIDIVGADVTQIPRNYFENLKKLTTMVMSDSITAIGENAFMGCTSLIDFVLPKDISASGLSASAFYDTAWYNNSSEFLKSGSGVLLLAPKNIPSEITAEHLSGVTEMSVGIFKQNNTITKVTFPNTLQSISVSAFLECANLSEIDFEDGCNITSIGGFAFSRCENLTKLNLEKCTKLETIGDYAFSGIGGTTKIVTKLTLPSSIVTLGTGVFSNSAVAEFEIIGSSNYVSEDGVLYEGVEKTTLYAYPTMKATTYFKIPSSVTKVCAGVFKYSGSKLKNLIICSENISISSDDVAATTDVYSKYKLDGLPQAKVMLAADNYTFNSADRSITLTDKYTPSDDTRSIDAFIVVEEDGEKKLFRISITGTTAKILKEIKDFPAELFFD